MAYSELQIYNLAVDAVGSTGTIETIDEGSREAELCSRWYGPVRDKILRAAHWQSAKKYARLAELANRSEDIWAPGMPGPAYHYMYSLPADLIIPRYISNFARFELTVADENTHALSTSSPTPILCYTAKISPQLMDSSLGYAIFMALAAAICQPLTGAANKARMLLQEANDAIISARLDSANSDNQQAMHVPDWIASRGFGTPMSSEVYLYPMGSLLTAGDLGG